jgi:hypothetical protein
MRGDHGLRRNLEADRERSFVMRKGLVGSAVAAAAVLAFLLGVLARTAGPLGAAKSAAPDITGVWRRSRVPPDNARQYTFAEMVGYIGEIPPMTPWATAKFKAAKPNAGPNGVPWSKSNDPQAQCFPPGVPRVYSTRVGSPFEIMQIPGRVIMFFEYDHLVRQIFTDGRQHPQDLIPSWMGDSIGRWEGDTLVADTVGFNDKTWLDAVGHPHSEALHLVERIRRVSHDAMNIDMTFDDPMAYTKPWVAHTIFELKPDWNIGEVVCEDEVNFSDTEKVLESGK